MKASRVIYSLLLLFLTPGLTLAQKSPSPFAQTTTPQATEPIERQMRKTVTVITLTCLKGNTQYKVQGTGFFVTVPDSRLPDGRSFGYLVTNRHVAMCWDENNNPMQVQSASVRLNLKDGSSTELPAAGIPNWVLPKDDSVDLALIPFGAPDSSNYEIRSIPVSSLVTEDIIKQESITEGLKIVFSGFFYQVPGLKQMEPIVREGIVAMMPNENIDTTTGNKGKLYLGEVHAFFGNSGSPVFVELGGFRNGSIKAGDDYRLLGVVSGGYFEGEGEESTLVIQTPLENKPINSGIVMIVPASELKALVDDPRVAAFRDAEISRQAQQQAKK